jgi:hypothetical protein
VKGRLTQEGVLAAALTLALLCGCSAGAGVGPGAPYCAAVDAGAGDASSALEADVAAQAAAYSEASTAAEAAFDSPPFEASVDEGAEAAMGESGSEVTDSFIDAASDGLAGAPAHCFDERKDGDESDVDCGGSCDGCGPHKFCYADFDCSATVAGCDTASGGCFCHYTMHVCVFSHCYDARKDANETGVDCGGATCGACSVGNSCDTDSDCSSSACDAITSTCTGSQCLDHQQDGVETDVDCGGGTCIGCTVGHKCLRSFDCQSGHVCSTTTNLCQ